MAIFAVLSQGDPKPLGASIKEKFASDYFEFENGKWFVAADGLTAREMSQKLGLVDPSNLTGVVVTIDGYFGHARADLWEWLKVKSTPAKVHG